MTKDMLLAYRPMRKESQDIERRLRYIERHPEPERAVLDPLRVLYEQKLQELTEAQIAIEQAIAQLSPVERQLIRLRYLDGLEWHRVCSRIHYEWRQTHRIHANALEKLKKL